MYMALHMPTFLIHFCQLAIHNVVNTKQLNDFHSKSITAKSCVPRHDSPGCTVAGVPNLAFSTQQNFL